MNINVQSSNFVTLLADLLATKAVSQVRVTVPYSDHFVS